MLIEITIAFFAALILQYFDAFVGMGFGGLTAILILTGFHSVESVTAVLFTSAVLSTITGILHHKFKNVDFKFRGKDFKISSVLVMFGIIGIIVSVFVALNIPEYILSLYVGILVAIIGFIIIFRGGRRYKFSWKKIVGLGSIAAFNKGMSGGGYGPVLASGQIVSGVKSKKAVGITAMTEGIVSFVGILVYLILGGGIVFNWNLILALSIGGLISTPFAVYSTKKFQAKKLRYVIGVISILIGTATILRVLVFN